MNNKFFKFIEEAYEELKAYIEELIKFIKAMYDKDSEDYGKYHD